MKELLTGFVGFVLLLNLSITSNGETYGNCDDSSKSQVELDRCLVKLAKDVDAKLQAVLNKAMAAAKELDNITAPRRDVVPALVLGQHAWMQYRDTHCEYLGTTWGGGSGTGIAITRCRISHTRSRIKELSEIEN